MHRTLSDLTADLAERRQACAAPVTVSHMVHDGSASARSPAPQGPVETISVLIVDAQFLVADALATALNGYDDIAVLAQRPTTGVQALKEAAAAHPAVVLLDYWLPDVDGPAAIRQLGAEAPDTKALTLSWLHDPEQIKTALQAGAIGYLPKSVSVAKVAEGIRRAAQGEDPVFGEKIAKLIEALRARADEVDDVADRFANLTTRELEVLQLLSTGASVVEIGHQIGITEATVRTHITRILRKIEAGSQLEAVTLARVAGLVP